MVLSAVLKLDGGAFTTGIGTAVEGIKSVIRISADLANKLSGAFDLGGMMGDLAVQIGEGVGSTMVLRQAFQDTGVGAEALGQTLAIMRRSLGGVSESGEPTGKMFRQLGLDIQELQGMGAQGQIEAISGAINELKTPAEQSAAAMAIFGRSGAKMLGLMKDPDAFAVAERSLGGLPALLERNADAFDAVSDRIGRIKEKGQGLWAGMAEGLLPLADQITGLFDGLDLTGMGQSIGNWLGTVVELFRAAPDTFGWGDAIMLALGEAVNWGINGFVKLGGVLLKALSTPIEYIQAAFQKVIETIMEWIGKIPKVGKALGLEGFKAGSYREMLDQAREEGVLRELGEKALAMPKLKLVNVDDEKRRLGQVWETAAGNYKTRIEEVQKSASEGMGEGFGDAGLEGTRRSGGGGGTIATDALARIGGYLGGGKVQERLVDLSARTAKGVERMVRIMESQESGAAAWG